MKTFLITALLVLSTNSAPALTLSVDFAQFYVDDRNTRVEMYYAFPDSEVKLIAGKDMFHGSIDVKVTISSAARIELEDRWVIMHNTANQQAQQQMWLIGQRDYVLAPGQYTLELGFRDENDSNARFAKKIPLIVKAKPTNRLAHSDIEFASSISTETDTAAWDVCNSRFVKNRLCVVPLPHLEVVGVSPELSVYSEIYNVKQFAPKGYTVSYTVLDNTKRELFSIPIQRPTEAPAQVERFSVPLLYTPSGVYFLQVMVAALPFNDDQKPDTIVTTKKFFLLNPEMPPTAQRYLSESERFERSEFSTMSIERVNEEFEKARVLASKADEQLWANLSELVAKQKYLFDFWANRDTKPETPENERYEKFQAAVRHANMYFSNPQAPTGWKSDQGRVLRKYGFPTQIDRFPSSPEVRPHEIWRYDNVMAGGDFIFVDVSGLSNFVLVHSTVVGEPRQDNWMDLFARVSRDRTNTNRGR